MKLIITTLTMIFISFGASALSVEELYKFCKPFQSNGFSLDNLSQNKVDKAFGCMAYIRGLAERGYVSCIYLRGFNKKELFEKTELEVIASLTANDKGKVNPLITSFINFAENNPKKWKFAPYNYAYKFITNVYPCKIKE